MAIGHALLAVLELLAHGHAGAATEREPPAEPPALELHWDAPSTCPDADDVALRLADYLGGRPHRAAVATGRITTTSQGYALQLEIDGQHKRVESTSCDDLGRAAALVLSIALAPEAERALELEPPRPAPSPPEPAPRVSPPVPAAPPSRATLRPVARPRRVRGALRLEGGLNFGVLRSFTDAGLVAAVLWPRARFELGGLFWSPDDIAGTPAGRRDRAIIGTVRATGCWTPRVPQRRSRNGPIEFPLCGGAELGAVRMDELGGPTSTTRHRLIAAATVTAAIAWPVHPNVAVWFGPGGVFLVNRPEFTFDDGARRYRVGPAAIRTSLGIEARFP